MPVFGAAAGPGIYSCDDAARDWARGTGRLSCCEDTFACWGQASAPQSKRISVDAENVGDMALKVADGAVDFDVRRI